MTNAKLAAYYAALPPDDVATIHVLNADTMTVRTIHVEAATERAVEQDDSLNEAEIANMLGQPLVRTE